MSHLKFSSSTDRPDDPAEPEKKWLKTPARAFFTAENGDDALSLALETLPDMIITDWKMPRVSGIDLCRLLRSSTITKHIYIIMPHRERIR